LNEHPLRNEPGYDNIAKNDKKNVQYNNYIVHSVYKTAIHYMLKHIPEGCEVFLPLIRNHFVQNFPNIEKKLNELIAEYNDIDVFNTCVYGGNTKGSYNYILQKLTLDYNTLRFVVNPDTDIYTITDDCDITYIEYLEMIKVKSSNNDDKSVDESADESADESMDKPKEDKPKEPTPPLVSQEQKVIVKKPVVSNARSGPIKSNVNLKAKTLNIGEIFICEQTQRKFQITVDKLGRKRWKIII